MARILSIASEQKKNSQMYEEKDVVDWRTCRNVEIEEELQEYIKLIRANPRASTPESKRNYKWEAERFKKLDEHGPVIPCRGLELNQVAEKSAIQRLKKDFQLKVKDNLAQFSVYAASSVDDSSQRQDEKKFIQIGSLSHHDDSSQRQDGKKFIQIGPLSHHVHDNMSKVLAIEANLTVKQWHNLRGAREKPQIKAAYELDRRDGELETVVREEFLRNKIAQIRTNNDRKATRHIKYLIKDNEQAATRLDELEQKAKAEALLRFEKLISKHEMRSKIKESSKFPQIKDLTQRPRRWCERGLIDALLSGNPKRAKRRLVSLCMFPKDAPETIRSIAKLAISCRKLKKDAHCAPSWLSKCVAEIDSGISNEPILISVVRLLLEGRNRDHTTTNTQFILPKNISTLTYDDAEIGTPLAFAKCLLLLHSFGISVEIVDGTEFSPLHHAAHFGDVACIDLLVARLGADINRRIPEGGTALHLAVCSKHPLAAVCKLVELGADVTVRNRCQQSALHLAAARGLNQVVELLLIAGADPILKDSKGNTPADIAYTAGHCICVDTIRSYRSPVTQDMQILSAAKRIELMTLRADANQIISAKDLFNQFAKIRFSDLQRRAPLPLIGPNGNKVAVRTRRPGHFAISLK